MESVISQITIVMKHAILIMAHRDIQLLKHLVRYFTHDCYVFIHIDKKSRITGADVESLIVHPQVCGIYREYDVHWGGFSMLEAELSLLNHALSECDADYFHLISGQDYPIKPLSNFLDFFESHRNVSFIEYNPKPVHLWPLREQWRYRFFLPYDRIDARSAERQKLRNWVSQQQRCRFMRRLPDQFTNLYKGSQWFSITRADAQLIVSYTQTQPAFYERLRYTFAPEETYVTTLLVYSSTNMLQNNNLRYIRWYRENGSNPSILGPEHYHDIMNSDALFARKMTSPTSDMLISELDYTVIYRRRVYEQA